MSPGRARRSSWPSCHTHNDSDCNADEHPDRHSNYHTNANSEPNTDTPTATPIPEGELVVAEIQADAPGTESDDLDKEFVAFRNDGKAPLVISGWTVSEGDDNQYTFQDVTLDPGHTIRLRTGAGSDTESDAYWGLESPVWNNDGDAVTVRDTTGTIVIEYQYE